MTVAYALLVIKDVIPSTCKEVEISFESEIWKEAMLEEINSLHKNDTWELSELPKEKKRQLVASRCMLRSNDLKMELLFATRPGW